MTMQNKRTAEEMARKNADETARYEGVDALAFTEIEWPTSQGRYHAIGVFRYLGKLRVRSQSSEWSRRVATTPKDLWLNTIYEVDDEQDNARTAANRWDNLPPVLASLIAEAAR